MTSKDLSIFNSLRPFSIGFDDMFDQFENMLGNGGLTMQSNYPPYNIRKTGKDKYSIEVALAGFSKKDVEIKFFCIFLEQMHNQEQVPQLPHLYLTYLHVQHSFQFLEAINYCLFLSLEV